MPSANVLYRKDDLIWLGPDNVGGVLFPLVEEHGYEVTDYQFLGARSNMSDGLLVSIMARGKEVETPSRLMEIISERSRKLAQERLQRKGADSSPEYVSYLSLEAYTILGEYSDNETAQRLFPALALGILLEEVGKKSDKIVHEVKGSLHDLGSKLTRI